MLIGLEINIQLLVAECWINYNKRADRAAAVDGLRLQLTSATYQSRAAAYTGMKLVTL